MKARGPTPCSRGWGARHPTSWAPWWVSTSIFYYMKSFHEKKIASNLSGRDSAATRWNQSRAPAELFCRGNFPPGGGYDHHRHHQRSSHREGSISITIFTSTISSQNPSSSLVSDLCLKTSYWYLWVASSVDYSL